MGFDIDIVRVNIRDGKAYLVAHCGETYLSFNWSDLSSICFKHHLAGVYECDCKKESLWYLREDLDYRRSDDILARLNKALDLLKKHGIVPGQPDMSNPSWGWGVRSLPDKSEDGLNLLRSERLPPKERLGVFAYHLERFRKLCQEHSGAFFISDYGGSDEVTLTLPDGNTVVFDRRNRDEVEEAAGPVTYMRHPIKGNFRIDNFDTAMEAYGLALAAQDPRAPQWYQLAMMMPDAPGK
jgi:hypothetical protein